MKGDRSKRWLPLAAVGYIVCSLVTATLIYSLGRQSVNLAPGFLSVFALLPVMIILLPSIQHSHKAARDNRAQLRELEETHYQLVKTTAHEMRNPLAATQGGLGLLRRRLLADRPREELLQILDTVEQESIRLGGFLEHFIEASQAQQGRLEIHRQAVSLQQLIDAGVAMVAKDPTHHVLVSRMEDEGLLVWGDRLRLSHLLGILLTNAIAYSPAGSTVSISVETRGNWAVVCISDQGIGIPRSELTSVFDCFHRGSNALQQGLGGAGLGLYVAQAIATGHGGRLWVKSSEDRGATFYVELPLYHTPSSISPP